MEAMQVMSAFVVMTVPVAGLVAVLCHRPRVARKAPPIGARWLDADTVIDLTDKERVAA